MEQGIKTKIYSTDVADATNRSIVLCPCSGVKDKNVRLLRFCSILLCGFSALQTATLVET